MEDEESMKYLDKYDRYIEAKNQLDKYKTKLADILEVKPINISIMPANPINPTEYRNTVQLIIKEYIKLDPFLMEQILNLFEVENWDLEIIIVQVETGIKRQRMGFSIYLW